MAINYQGGNDVVVTQAFAPMMKTLQQNYLYELEKRKQEQKEANDLQAQARKDLAKINPNGIWEGDAKLVSKAYDEIKELNFQMEKARTPEEKRMKSLEMQGKVTELMNLISNSKEFKKGWLDQYTRVPTQVGKMNTSKAISYLDSAKGKSSLELGSDYLTGVNNFYYNFDEAKEMTEFRKRASAFVKNSSNFTRDDSGLKTVTRGQRTYQEGVIRYLPNETKILELTSDFFKSSPERENMLSTYMERNQITDRNQAIAKFATENMDLFTKPDKEERISTSRGGITVNVNTGNQNFTDPANAIVDNYVIAIAKQPIKGDYGVTPRGGEVALKNYLQFNQTQNIGGVLEGIDPETGKKVSSEGYATKAQVLGLGTDQSGRIYAHISYQPDPYIDEIKTMIVDADRYLNTSQISRTKASYVNELAKRGVKLRGQNKTNQQTNNNNKQPSKSLSGGNVR